ncbi:MAG: 30S ribosomal protein S9 [Candidatus Aureabacteria bacterium]|nr:30S ribosomal protein S9 [Candidatus Auribacterota bacterium]
MTIGRRKKASARVRMTLGSGKFNINGVSLETYFPSLSLKKVISFPLTISKSEKRFDFNVTLSGGGKSGQAEALRLGISRAICKFDEKMRTPLKSASLLSRDQRMKERKKYGQAGARKRFQFSKR